MDFSEKQKTFFRKTPFSEPDSSVPQNWETANGGGANHIGGGGTYCTMHTPKPVLEALENGIGLVCARFLESKWQGVDKRRGGGGNTS